MNRKIIFTMCLFGLAFGSPLSAQEECSPGVSTSVSGIVDAVEANCCSKSGSKQNKCINGAIKKLNKAKASLSKTFTDEVKSELRNLKSVACADQTIECTDGFSVTTTELSDTVTGKCCGAKRQASRKSCLKKARRALNKARKFVGSEYVATAKGSIKTLLKAKSCGKGGVKSSCDTTRGNSDGQGGFVWKPVSDSTGSVVVLFPSSDSPRSCRFENSSGKKIYSAFSSGRTNGFRETIRPSGGPRCSSFPSNSVINCEVNGRRVCYKAPSGCNRYD